MLHRPPYAFELRLQGPYGVVRADGELDLAAVPELRAGVRRAARRAGHVVVDLRDVTFMDTYALRALVRLQCETGSRRAFHVVPGDGIQRVVDLDRARAVLRWMSAEQLAG